MELSEKPIEILEIVQAGDVFLLKVFCPLCGRHLFCGFPLSKCPDCGDDISNNPLMLHPETRRRCLVGTERKTRLGKRLVQRMLLDQEWLCAYCYCNLRDVEFHVEHIKPLCVGGDNTRANLCISCAPCNLKAGSKVFSSFRAKQDYILEKRSK